MPLLERTQFRHVMFPAFVHQCILKSPADARGVRSQRRSDIRRQTVGQSLHIFQDTGTRPVKIRAILENHIHKRVTEEGITAHHPNVRRTDEFGDYRISDLVFNQTGAAPFPLGKNDNLHVGQVGNGIQRRIAHAEYAADGQRRHQHENHELVSGAPLDNTFDKAVFSRQRFHIIILFGFQLFYNHFTRSSFPQFSIFNFYSPIPEMADLS